MKLVVDTNILVSFFRQNPVNEIISKSKPLNLQLLSPEYAIDELRKNKEGILKYSGLDEKQFEKKLSELLNCIKLISDNSFKEFELEAERLIHDKDIPFFALTLKFKCLIWSNESLFKKQSKIKVFSNREIIELFI